MATSDDPQVGWREKPQTVSVRPHSSGNGIFHPQHLHLLQMPQASGFALWGLQLSCPFTKGSSTEGCGWALSDVGL